MKNIFTLLILLGIVSLTAAQEWTRNLPQDKLQQGMLTFYEIRDAFNDYCEEIGVDEKGMLTNPDGTKSKMPYYKIFRRWEWYWEPRVDPVTGEFPLTTAWEAYRQFLGENPERSLSGNWTSLGPNTSPGGYAGLGRLNCVAFRPGDNNTIYAGAASGGIWKSADGGSTWTPLGDGNPVLGVSDILVFPQSGSPDILYIATGDRDAGCIWTLGGGQNSDNNSVGVLKSIDGGQTWSPTGLTFNPSQQQMVNRLLVDPANSNTIYAATSAGLYKTINGGTNWTLLVSQEFIDMEFHPANTSYMYGSTIGGGTSIYRSTNGGADWNLISSYSGNRTELAVSPNQPDYVFAVVSNDASGLEGVYRSTNSGASFTQVYSGSTKNLLGWECNGTGTGGQGWYDLAIAVDPNNANNIYVGGVNIWKSTNGGTTFSIVTHWAGYCVVELHADQHNLAFQNGTSTLFVCNDGGLYKTSNGGSTFTHLTSGMAISQVYRLGVAQTTPNDVILGLQDNGTKAMLNGNWSDVIGGDGFECAIKPTDHNVQYGSIYYGQFFRTTDHWVWDFTDITTSLGGSGFWVTPFAIDPTIPTTIYAGYQDVVKSTNQGTNWTKISNWSGSELRHLAIAPSNSSYICAATTNTLYRTTNGGSNWSNITGTLPVGQSAITYISIKNDDPNTIWVSFGAYNAHGVYESTNGGSAWTNISTGLPQLPVMCVVQNKQNTDQVELYAGTDAGAYVKPGSGPWISFSSGLPNVVVTELDIYYDNTTPANSRIRASTYGRGLWESDLYTPGTVPAADFSANFLTPEANEPVQFTDLSTNDPTSWHWSFSPSTVAYIGGTDSTSQFPLLQFADTGFYDVTLIAANAFGADTNQKPGYIHVVDCTIAALPFTEEYPGGIIPTCWKNLDHAGYGQAWRFDNPGGRTIYTTTATNGFAILDSDYYGPGTSQDADLVTPVLNLVTYVGVRLEFEHYFLSDPGSSAVLAFSLDSGTTWSPLETWVSTTANAELFSMDVSGQVAGEPFARFKWNYTGSDNNYWAVDDIHLFGTEVMPAADFFADTNLVLVGETVLFTDASTGSPDNWVWTFEGGSPASFTGQAPPPIQYNSPGTFNAVLYVSNIWGDSTLVRTGYIRAGMPPEAAFTADETTIFPGDGVNFTDQTSYDPFSWEWTFTGGVPETSNLQDPGEIIYPVAGLYDVRLKVTNDYGMDSLLQENYIEVLPIGTDELASGNRLNIYPNPSDGTFNIGINGGPMKVTIYDHIGRMIYEKELETGLHKVVLEDFARGICLLRAESTSTAGLIIRRIIIR